MTNYSSQGLSVSGPYSIQGHYEDTNAWTEMATATNEEMAFEMLIHLERINPNRRFRWVRETTGTTFNHQLDQMAKGVELPNI